MKVIFFLDPLEFKYFSFNKLVTSFWLVKEACLRNYDVFISTSDKLYLNNNIPNAFLSKVNYNNKSEVLINEKELKSYNLNNFDIIFFRPDPPVDINYIYSTYILDYLDNSKTIVINSSSGIRKANEKVYINNFPGLIPNNIVTSNISLIKDFINEYNEVIIKPLNKCFGKGVFYLRKSDKNINTILDISTESGKNAIMAQEFIRSPLNGDIRANIICGHVFQEAIVKISGDEDFKFNAQRDEYFKKIYLNDKQKEVCNQIVPKLIEDGLYLVGLDMIEDKIIEINVTSPCFFINEMNKMYNIELEKTIMDLVEKQVSQLKNECSKFRMTCSINI